MIKPINNLNFKAIHHRNSSEEIFELMQKTKYEDALSLITHHDIDKNTIRGDFFLATDNDAKEIRKNSTELLKENASFDKVLKVLTEELFKKMNIKLKPKTIRLVAIDEITKDVLDSEHKIRLFSPEGQMEL